MFSLLRASCAAILVLGLAACATSSPAQPAQPSGAAQPSPAALSFTAYQGEWSDPELIVDLPSDMTVVAVDGLNVLPAGGAITPASGAARRQLAAAHTAGLPAEIMIGNFDTDAADFSPALARATLDHASTIDSATTAVADFVRDQGWDGVSVDFESLSTRDTAGLLAFVRELRVKLDPEASLSIALMVQTTAEDYAAAGYNLGELNSSIDRFVLMAYDEHGPWEDNPGPIGSLAWQSAGLAALASEVPAQKIELGVAGYGYGWGPSSDGQLSVARARQLAGDRARFDAKSGEWTATLADGTELWWSDIRSFRLRVALAHQTAIGGVALWVLELGDPIGSADLK